VNGPQEFHGWEFVLRSTAKLQLAAPDLVESRARSSPPRCL